MTNKRFDFTYYRNKASTQTENNNNLGSLISTYRSKKLFDFDEKLHVQLGNTSFLQGNFTKALRHIRIALAIYPRSEEALDLCGLLMLHFGKYDEAIIKFKRAILGNPFTHLSDIHWSLAIHLQGKEEESERVLKDTFKISFDGLEVYAEKFRSLLSVVQKKLLEEGLKENEKKPLEALLEGYEWILRRVNEEEMEKEQIRNSSRIWGRPRQRRTRGPCVIYSSDMMKYHRLFIRRDEIEED